MQKLTLNETLAFLNSHDHFCILSHRRPDGDTIGSTAALCLGLRKLGKTAHILENPEIGPRFAALHQGLTKAAPEPGDCLVSTDVAAGNMLPAAFEAYRDSIALRIDHHGLGESFAPMEYVDAQRAACAEIIWEILTGLSVEIDAAMASAIYVGTSTDTGCFRFANTNAHTFQVAAACAQAGADIFGINQALFETNSLARLKMQAWIVDNLRIYREGSVVLSVIPKAVEEALGVTSEDMDNISSFPRSIAGVRMAATLREDGPEKIKISIRSVPGLDAAAVAARFGGGGHKGAAGGVIHLPLEEAATALCQAMLESVGP